MKGGQPAKDFYTSGNGDNHCSGSKVCSGVNIHANSEHVVGSHDEPQEANCHHSSDHAHIPERFFFTGIIGDDVGDHSEAWKNKDIYFGVPKESE